MLHSCTYDADICMHKLNAAFIHILHADIFMHKLNPAFMHISDADSLMHKLKAAFMIYDADIYACIN